MPPARWRRSGWHADLIAVVPAAGRLGIAGVLVAVHLLLGAELDFLLGTTTFFRIAIDVDCWVGVLGAPAPALGLVEGLLEKREIPVGDIGPYAHSGVELLDVCGRHEANG
jgi:hypothetical protein